ncbi:MAG: trans-2-enoyl-CoA reductase family protein [Puniceicoccales bacterium]|jgi:enoyl-[acyl-carrier protein] reductase/trans-2-enoyl-CoA reductase (NAD+)|nr:trans-2-enoyl-CoA reductase family protein [Puniceicoccales bacterium]
MIVKPKIRGFVCLTAHPTGCEKHMADQIGYVKRHPSISGAPKKVLILGSSTGYGLATRIASAFGGKAETFGVYFERPPAPGKPASAGWYNNRAFEKNAAANGILAHSLNGDAFSEDVKKQVVESLRKTVGPVDTVVYSLAAPRRNGADGKVHKSVLKPIGQSFTGKTLDTDHVRVFDITLPPASENEIADTVKVMGGEDWEQWIRRLDTEGLLADGIQTLAYSYIGPRLTWPIYRDGTIGRAKDHLYQTAQKLNSFLGKKYHGKAIISINKAVVTQASSAIPVVPLYLSILFKHLAEKGLQEDCIQQMYRLWKGLYATPDSLTWDPNGYIRLDDHEMHPDIQDTIGRVWPQVTTETLSKWADFPAYQKNFLQLFGFGLDGIDYEKEVEIA